VSLSRRWVLALAAALAGLLIWILWPRGPVTPEERIRRQVIDMARAAEHRDLSFIMEQVSPRFRSHEGWDRDEVKSVLASEILRGQWVRVFVVDFQVTVDTPRHAQMKGKFWLGRSDAKTLKELAAQSQVQGYEIDGELELEDGDWRFVSASHQPLDPSQFL
jgi:hypothetical protein